MIAVVRILHTAVDFHNFPVVAYLRPVLFYTPWYFPVAIIAVLVAFTFLPGIVSGADRQPSSPPQRSGRTLQLSSGHIVRLG